MRHLQGPAFAVALAALVILPCRQASGACLEIPKDALLLIEKSRTESCALCARQFRKEAFAILDAALAPGTQIVPAGPCVFEKGASPDVQEFTLSPAPGEDGKAEGGASEHAPEVVFVFHTRARRLVGIPERECTADEVAAAFRGLAPKSGFRGRARLVRFAYGEGRTFTYLVKENRIVIHCRLEEVSPAKAGP
ncbi:MAG TPA: hypothetical protein PLS81_11370 [Deltaproteobacteria bacterium]|nr:hypothetical protein [Deltaproteobacteria bacterium]HOM30042.1 hypothetical protein [Deltaproteobacteria bacterium]HPP80924.1 hypothetical protein [Deltaproteobacteria bacterium]